MNARPLSAVVLVLGCAGGAIAQSIDAYAPVMTTYPTSLATQADGKMIVVGNFLAIGATARARVARLNIDGSLDTSFADASVDSEVKTVALQADGKLLIGGGFTHAGGQARHYLARLNDDGTLDGSFVDPQLDGTVWSIALQADGKILAGGDFTHIGAIAQNYFARLDASGNFDSSFPNPQFCCSVVRAVALQSGGRILVGGAFTEAGGVNGHYYLARFSSNGAFDPSFPNVPESIVLLANDIVVEPDDSVLLGGSSDPSVRKLHADGTLDTGFVGAAADGSTSSIALQPDGKMLIGGTFEQVGGQARHALARLNANGWLDASFADQNFAFDATDPHAYIFGIATQADGKAVVIGNFSRIGQQSHSYMARVITGDHITSNLVVQPGAGNVSATWYRSGGGPELAQAPMLQHSTDGVNFTTASAMTKVAYGWHANAPYNVFGPRFYLRVLGATSAGADNASPGQIASAVWSSDTIFVDSFE